MTTDIQMIPVEQIRVLNPRARNKAKFTEIVGNISKLGLKKPITVSRRSGTDAGYDLVCGQGRLEAYVALGQSEVPAVVKELSRDDCYIMSLVENLARRKHTTMDFVRELVALKERGYSPPEIAAKVDLSETYVRGLLRLFTNGEERLLGAVERGDIPIAMAIQIASSDDESLQKSLTTAYESGQLRGKALLRARSLIEERRTRGKAMRTRVGRRDKKVTTEDLVRTYTRETQRQKLLVKKARLCEHRLTFVTSALRDLHRDENFVNLLRAEALDAIPKYLADAIAASGK